MEKPFSATPFLRQLYKGLSQEGNELLMIPYSGRSVQSQWWKCYPNPNYAKGEILEKILKKTKNPSKKINSPLIPFLARKFAKPNIEKLIKKILFEEKNIGAILFIAIPINQIKGLVNNIKKICKIPILFYDVDLPTSLPTYGGFTFNYYTGADLSEFDCFLITSEGSASRLKEMGAPAVEIVHIGVDPDEYNPTIVSKDIDFFFFGHGGTSRKNYIKMMITEPSKKLKYNFVMGGTDYEMDLGNAKIHFSEITFQKWKEYSCRAKVNLNIVHELHAQTYATSTARPFELAAMGCCIVSSPYQGLEKWFNTKKEILVANSTKEALEIYQMLMDNPDLREKMANEAQKHVKNEHTSRHRARQIIEIIHKFR